MINATILGNLIKDPELKSGPNSSFAVFTVASNNPKKKRDAEDTSTFVNCVLWGNRAEAVCNHLKKGDKIMVVGEMFERQWESGDKSGKSLDMDVNNFAFVGGKKDSAESAPAPVKATPNTAAKAPVKATAAVSALDEDFDPFKD